MNEIAVAFLGDVVGSVGRRAVAHAVPVLRERYSARLVIVNGENARQGSGITPDNARELFRSGASAITLGDHAFKDRAIIPLLEDPGEPICRPANLALGAPGKRMVRMDIPGLPPVYVFTVLGRMFMPLPSDNPFEAVDREMNAIRDPAAAVIVEVHAEATSEKQALAWHCLEKWTSPDRPRIVAVVGTHTHVQTADARILEHSLAAMTDVGMSGPHRGVIGRSAEATVKAMSTQAPVPLDVATEDVRACGCVVRFDAETRRAIGIEAVDIAVRE
jgi:metallophosphoesterase (TIGR00282 family)